MHIHCISKSQVDVKLYTTSFFFSQKYKYIKICFTNSFLIFIVVYINQVSFAQMTLTTINKKIQYVSTRIA